MTMIRWGWLRRRACRAADYSDEARCVMSELEQLDEKVPPLADAMQLASREDRRGAFAELIEQAMAPRARHG